MDCQDLDKREIEAIKNDKWVDFQALMVLSVSFLSNLAHSIPALFLPFEFQRMGISQTMSGWIFSTYMVAGILFGPFVSPTIQRFGRKKPMMIGLMLYGAAFLCFASLPLVKNHKIYVGYGFLIRFI